MRVAVLILASHAPRALAATARYFAPSEADLFVHIDARVQLAGYLAQTGALPPRARVLNPRRKVYWAGFSMVEATLDLLREAVRQGPYARYLFISDNSLPVQSLDGCFARLAASEDLIVCVPDPADPRVRARYDGFHLTDDEVFDGRRGGAAPQPLGPEPLRQIEGLLALKARGKKPLRLFYGQASWALSHDSAQRALAVADSDPWLIESCRYSAHADEFFFQSIVGAAKYPGGLWNSPTYADGFRFAPRIIRTARDLPFDMHPHFLFLRKIAPDFEPGLPETCLRLYGRLRDMLANDPGTRSERVIALAEGDARRLNLFAPVEDDPAWGGVENLWGRRFRRMRAEVWSWRLRGPADWPAVQLSLPCVAGNDAILRQAFFEIDGRRAPLMASDIGYAAEFRDLPRAFDAITLHAPANAQGGSVALAVMPEA